MPLTSGTRLGAYEIQSSIGAGGMGEVYRARDTRLDRTVAIKILPAAVSTDPDRLLRFQHEARILSTLNPPNVLAIFDVGEQNDVRYLVSEFLEGQSLREVLAAGALPRRKGTEYALEIANRRRTDRREPPFVLRAALSRMVEDYGTPADRSSWGRSFL